MEGRGAALAAAEGLDQVSFLDREYAALSSVTLEEVRAAAARYLQPDSVSAVAYVPEGAPSELAAAALERAFAVTALRKAPTQPVALPRVRPVDRTGGRWEAGVLHTELPGADLLVRRKFGVPLVTLGIYVPRLQFDPSPQAGLGALTVRCSVRGAGDLDAGQLAFAFERLGGTLSATAASDWLGFGTTIVAEHLGEAATLLHMVFATPTLNEDEVNTERGLMIIEAEQVTDDMFRYPFQLAFAEAFGDGGYGLPVNGLPNTLPMISAADVRAWHRHALLGARPVIVAVGDVDPEAATAVLGGVFQHADRAPRADLGTETLQSRAESRDQATRVVDREKAQSALAMVFPGPRRRDPERAAAEVWAAIASGLGGRMFEALRDQRSLAYTVMASSWQKARAGALVTYIATSPEREEEARAAMLDELARFGREPVSARELAQAVNYLAGQAEVSRQSGAAVAGEMLEAWLIGNGLSDLENPGAVFHQVSAADVLRIAELYLQPAQRVEGVVRGTGISSPVAG